MRHTAKKNTCMKLVVVKILLIGIDYNFYI